MTAGEAMKNAIMYARDGIDMERSRIWLDIARELREEYYARKAWEVVAPAAPETTSDTRTQEEVRADQTQVFRMPVDRPGDPVEAEATCRHCGYFIKRESENAFLVGHWVHVRTDIPRCPVKTPAADETFIYTYAEPESSVRS